MPSVIMLSVIMLGASVLSVVAPAVMVRGLSPLVVVVVKAKFIFSRTLYCKIFDCGNDCCSAGCCSAVLLQCCVVVELCCCSAGCCSAV